MDSIRGVGFLLKNIIPVHMLIFISGSLASTPEIPSSVEQMKSVKDKILNGYDRTIRPTLDGLDSTLVAVELIPRQILEVDEERGLFVLDSHLSLIWVDPRLKWDITKYHGILQLPADSLWVPNVIIHNSHITTLDPNGEAFLSVLAEGFVIWIPKLRTQTSCKTFTHPNDVITCEIKIGSNAHDGWGIDIFRDKHLLLKKFLNINPRWELLVSQTRVITNKTTHKDRVSLNVIFPMKRRIPSEIGVTRQLCAIVVVLNLAIFWLPPNSSKKILLGMMLFLVLMQLLLYAAWSVKYPLTTFFTESSMQSALYIVVTTLLYQLLVIFNLCNITEPPSPPTDVMRLLRGPLRKFLCLRFPVDVNKNIPLDAFQLQESALKTLPSPTTRDDWMLLASCLDKLFFMLLSVVTIAIYS